MAEWKYLSYCKGLVQKGIGSGDRLGEICVVWLILMNKQISQDDEIHFLLSTLDSQEWGSFGYEVWIFAHRWAAMKGINCQTCQKSWKEQSFCELELS